MHRDWYRDVAQAELDRFRRRLSWPGSLTGVSSVCEDLAFREKLLILALIIGALLVYIAIPRKQWSDVGRMLLALVGTMAFFAVAMALSQPRYLPLLKGALHPHLRL